MTASGGPAAHTASSNAGAVGRSFGSPIGAPASTQAAIVSICACERLQSFLKRPYRGSAPHGGISRPTTLLLMARAHGRASAYEVSVIGPIWFVRWQETQWALRIGATSRVKTGAACAAARVPMWTCRASAAPSTGTHTESRAAEFIRQRRAAPTNRIRPGTRYQNSNDIPSLNVRGSRIAEPPLFCDEASSAPNVGPDAQLTLVGVFALSKLCTSALISRTTARKPELLAETHVNDVAVRQRPIAVWLEPDVHRARLRHVAEDVGALSLRAAESLVKHGGADPVGRQIGRRDLAHPGPRLVDRIELVVRRLRVRRQPAMVLGREYRRHHAEREGLRLPSGGRELHRVVAVPLPLTAPFTGIVAV